MTKTLETSKQKKLQVFVANELKYSSNKPEEAIAEVQKFQKENVPEIALVNNESKVTNLYRKGRYDQNYKITKGVYPFTLPVAVQEAE